MKRYSLKLINVIQYHLGLNMLREKRNKWKEIRKLFAHVTYSVLLRILQLLRREGFYEGFEGAAAIAEAREQQQQQPPKQLLRISLGRIGAHHVRSTCAYVFSSMWHSYVHTRSPRTDTPRAGTRAFSKYYRTIFLPPPPRALSYAPDSQRMLTFLYASIDVCFLIEHPRTNGRFSPPSLRDDTALFPSTGAYIAFITVSIS